MSVQAIARFGDLAPPEVAPTPGGRRAGTADAQARTTVPLTSLKRNAGGTVAGVRVGAPGTSADKLDPADERMALRLIEIGFVEGATLRVIAFGQPGNDPIGVRVGGRGGVSTFALRRAEAACVWVWPATES
jgi:ferrous iron transport protein A